VESLKRGLMRGIKSQQQIKEKRESMGIRGKCERI
jgi:hypothetical protein